jgi:hypothetical protein
MSKRALPCWNTATVLSSVQESTAVLEHGNCSVQCPKEHCCVGTRQLLSPVSNRTLLCWNTANLCPLSDRALLCWNTATPLSSVQQSIAVLEHGNSSLQCPTEHCCVGTRQTSVQCPTEHCCVGTQQLLCPVSNRALLCVRAPRLCPFVLLIRLAR